MEAMVRAFKVGPEEVERISAAPNEPHQHDYEELFIGAAGELEHFIDFRSETIEAPFVGFVTKGKIHRVRPRVKDGRCALTVIRFRSEFIPETIFQLYSLFHDQAQMRLGEGRCFERLTSIADMIVEELAQPTPDLAVVRQLLGTPSATTLPECVTPAQGCCGTFVSNKHKGSTSSVQQHHCPVGQRN